MIREHPDYEKLKSSLKDLEQYKNHILSEVEKEVFEETTIADKRIKQLFALSRKIDTSGTIFNEASERSLRHNPPGKGTTLGDRLNWVGLLKSLPENSELHIISKDGDFSYSEYKDDIMPYLKHEWESKNGGNVILWKRLSQFMSKSFKGAKNAQQLEHEIATQRLETSLNFASTHKIVSQFPSFEFLSKEHARRISTAMLINKQVRWISGDDDIKLFIQKFIKFANAHLDQGDFSKLNELITDDTH